MGKIGLSQSVLEMLYVPVGGGGGEDATVSVSHSVVEFLYTPTSSPTTPQHELSQSVLEFLYRTPRAIHPQIALSQSVAEFLYSVPTTPPPPPSGFFSCGAASSWVPSASAQETRCEDNG